MARLPYVELSEPSTSPELAEIRSTILGLGRAVHNHHLVLANQPAALRAFMHMSRYVRDETSISPRLRELAILATAYAKNIPYEIYYHSQAARRAGVSEQQLAALPNWATSDAFDATERVVLSYADQVARRLDVDEATFQELRARFSPGEIVELAMIVGWYHLVSALIGPLHIEVGEHHS